MHFSGVAKSNISFGWGKGAKVTAAGWEVTLCNPVWHAISHSGVVISILNCCISHLLHINSPGLKQGAPKNRILIRRLFCAHFTSVSLFFVILAHIKRFTIFSRYFVSTGPFEIRLDNWSLYFANTVCLRYKQKRSLEFAKGRHKGSLGRKYPSGV